MSLSTDSSSSSVPLPLAAASSRSPIKVIAVDDDDFFREMLANELEAHGFAVETFPDAQSLLESVDVVAAADVIILDWAMPRITGIDLLPQLRRLGVNLPVIFLTGRALAANEALALDRGAMDFVDKSRGMQILAHRLRLVAGTKVPEPRRERILQCGRLVLKPQISRAFWDDTDVDLTVGEFKIVHLLAENVGHHVTYRQIYDCMHYQGFVAGYGANGYHVNVRSAIKRVRNKFRVVDPGFAEIENYAAFGYVWQGRRGASL
jgi:two-component system, OmpR family, response regulator ChvI